MKTIMLAVALTAAAMLAACDDERAPSPGPYPSTTNYVEAAPYPDGTQK